MYNSGLSSTAINTGVPAVVFAVTAGQLWSVVAGVTLVLVGLVNLVLLARSGRVVPRAFPAA